MHVVILGSGIFGLNLASLLISDGHDITIIENDENKCNKIAHKLDAIVLCGNGTDTEILNESNLSEADVFVAATENDDFNLLACILVKGYKVPTIISQVTDANHKDAFKDVGIDIIINPGLTAANYIEKRITRPNIADLTILGKGDAELLDFTLGKGKYIGKRIGDLIPNDKFNIVAVYENGNIIMPKPDVVLKSGIKISLLVKTKFAEDVLKHFNEDTAIEILPGIKLE